MADAGAGNRYALAPVPQLQVQQQSQLTPAQHGHYRSISYGAAIDCTLALYYCFIWRTRIRSQLRAMFFLKLYYAAALLLNYH
eukprot:2607-Heterococcus_DN1.PRE.13